MAILLTTLNARYHHSALGLRYLQANLRELKPRSKIREFTLAQSPRDIAEAILAENPRIAGFGVYIWNARPTYDVVSVLKRLKPELVVVLGGPEVSYETETQPLCQLADFTIQGEADVLFYELCRALLVEGRVPERKWLSGPPPELQDLVLPYSLYSDEDIRNRVIYVEASRGCPYRCEYCLSSLDPGVRAFELEPFLDEMRRLVERGARCFKFLDRTFNLSPAVSTRILRFFLDRIGLGLFLHFEMVPDRLPPALRELIRQFPAGSLQFEVGIQSWSPEVAARVSRRQDYARIRENFGFLRRETGAHLHADLIVGLPGETLESFAEGFDAVASLEPHEIQIGILKRLKGTPIMRHDREWEMVYQEHPPFEVLQTRTMGFETIQRLHRFSRFWDLVANSGNFVSAVALLREQARLRADGSFFHEFDELASFLAHRHPQGHGVALLRLVESVWLFLREREGLDRERARSVLVQDYTVRVKRDVPAFLRGDAPRPGATARPWDGPTPARQRRHLEREPGAVSGE